MTAPDPGAASSARDKAVRVVYAAVEALPLGADEGVAMATSVDSLRGRPDVLAALAAEAGLVVLDPHSNVDIQRLGHALAVEGLPGHTSYYASRALTRLAEERTR